MKFKYFLRGLGLGIVFTAIIFLTAYQGADRNRMSDAEVMERARELGMVEKNDPIKELLTTEAPTEKLTSEAVTEKVTTELTTKEAATEEKETKEVTTEITTEEKTTEITTEKKTTEEKSTEKSTTEETALVLTIKSGDTSYPVCERLKDLGIIDNADDFDNYLIQHNYANRLRIGEHKLKKGMDYHSIAEAISDPT